MSADSDRIDKLVASVSEGSPVDWPKVEAKDTGEEDLSCLAALEKVAHIAEFNRRLQRLGGARELHLRRLNGLSAWIPAVDSPPSLFRWGHLEALELVGRGSFGEVYRAIDTRLQREVALKLRRGESAATGTSDHRFLNEARDLARVRHPNVIVVHGADFHGDQIGFWTDFIHGQTLAERLAARGPLREREVVLIGLDLCRALDAVHAAGLVHGDVKASNAMIEESGRVVLMDFGAARTWMDEKPGRRILGSPLIMAPEILDGRAPTPPADLYSLGVLLFQLASGRLPFVADSIPELRLPARAGSAADARRAAAGFAPSARRRDRSLAESRLAPPLSERGRDGERAPCGARIAAGEAACASSRVRSSDRARDGSPRAPGEARERLAAW